MTAALVTAPTRQAKVRSAPSLLDFFAHHGIWAPGVRLFRKVNFTAKALLVSLAFMVPIVLLMVAYLKTVQDSINFTSDERAGVQLLVKIEPLAIEVQKQRRLVMSGQQTAVDLAAIDAKLNDIKAEFDSLPGGIDGRSALEKAVKAHQAVVAAAQSSNDARRVTASLQEYVEAIRSLRNTVLDLSNLSLDPEQATYYLMSVSTTVASDLAESVSRSRALAGASEHEAQSPQQSRLLYAIWYDGQQQIDTVADQVARAAMAEPSVTARLPVVKELASVKAFYDASEKRWFGEQFSASTPALNAPGQEAVDSLRKIAGSGTQLLGKV